jgi:PKD repeat protein
LQGHTTYYWYLVARDSHNAQTASPVWSFTTTYVPPAADFTANVTNGLAPLTVNFFDRSHCSDDTIVSWAWDFSNDGVIDSSLQNPANTYTAAGNYSVVLTVRGAYGGQGQ